MSTTEVDCKAQNSAYTSYRASQLSFLNMGERVKQFLERVADVPTELRQRLALIRDLDDKASQLQRDIEDNVKQQLSESHKPHNKGSGKRQKLHAGSTFDVDTSLSRLMSLADEKVSDARTSYVLCRNRDQRRSLH